MKIEKAKVKDLKPYERNPRFNDEAVEAVANSIKEFGFKVPIVIDKNNVIVTGHTRWKACKKLGIEEVPVVIADDLTDEQVKAFRLADNKVGELATWDEDLLDLEMFDLGLDMKQFGFIDDIDEPEEKKEKERTYQRMELKSFEHYDYLVFVFDNQMDFLQMAQMFGLHKVDAGYSTRKLGIGRVLKGAKLIEATRDKGNNPEPSKSEDDKDTQNIA